MGMASACVVGVESKATSGLCASGSGGKVSTGGTHRAERAGERTGISANEWGPRDIESRRVCAEGTGVDRSTPPGSERERERMCAYTGRR
jgi:hypothetical protein